MGKINRCAPFLLQKSIIRLLVLASIPPAWLGFNWAIGEEGWTIYLVLITFLYALSCIGLLILHPIGWMSYTALVLLFLKETGVAMYENIIGSLPSHQILGEDFPQVWKWVAFEFRYEFPTTEFIILISLLIYLWLPQTRRLFEKGFSRKSLSDSHF